MTKLKARQVRQRRVQCKQQRCGNCCNVQIIESQPCDSGVNITTAKSRHLFWGFHDGKGDNTTSTAVTGVMNFYHKDCYPITMATGLTRIKTDFAPVEKHEEQERKHIAYVSIVSFHTLRHHLFKWGLRQEFLSGVRRIVNVQNLLTLSRKIKLLQTDLMFVSAM